MRQHDWTGLCPAPPWLAGFFVFCTSWLTACALAAAESPGSLGAAIRLAGPGAGVQKQAGPLSYSEVTVVWGGEGFPLAPPYLANFSVLEPAGPVGSYLKGSYLGSGDMYVHAILLPKTKVQYSVDATSGPADLAIAVAVPWPHFRPPAPDSLVLTVTLWIDAADSVVVPVPVRPSRTFFGGGGTGREYSLPQVLLLDLPEGKRTVAVGVKSGVARFAIVAAGAPEAKPAPLPLSVDAKSESTKTR